MTTLPRLMLVTDCSLTSDQDPAAPVLAAIGQLPMIVQLREKGMRAAERERFARRIQQGLIRGGVLVVNSDAALASRLGAGLHRPARSIGAAASPRPLGRSVHDLQELELAIAEQCDYVVAGPVFPTTSKPGATTLGLAGLSELVAASPVPLFAIGGVDRGRVRALLAAGAHGVAVRSAILLAPDPGQEAAGFGRELTAAGRRTEAAR